MTKQMKRITPANLAAYVVLLSASTQILAQPQVIPKEKNIQLYVTVNAPVDSVWSRWSTEKGLKKFFAPAAVQELKTFGKFEMLFNPAGPAGQRGAENNMILAVEDKKMISFTWDAPPQYPLIRAQRTVVTVRLYPTTDSKTIVTLTQSGWGLGQDWQTVRDYFEKAWGGFVLPSLKYSLEVKPMDWTGFPNNMPKDMKPAEAF
jgi:uncharacterized protein YndB with AHSA1/START domain